MSILIPVVSDDSLKKWYPVLHLPIYKAIDL